LPARSHAVGRTDTLQLPAQHGRTAVRDDSTKLAVGLDLLDGPRRELPRSWVRGANGFGRVPAFRAELRSRDLRYVLDLPANTLIRDVDEAPAASRRRPPWW